MAQDDHTPPGHSQRIDVYLHLEGGTGDAAGDVGAISEKLDTIISLLTQITVQEDAQMADLAALQASVDAQSSVVDGAVALIQGLSQALKDAVAANDPAAIQAVIDELDANTSELATAVDNVPHPEAQA